MFFFAHPISRYDHGELSVQTTLYQPGHPSVKSKVFPSGGHYRDVPVVQDPITMAESWPLTVFMKNWNLCAKC